MKDWQWGWVMFGLVMVCYYLTGKQETSLIAVGFVFLVLGTCLSLFKIADRWDR